MIIFSKNSARCWIAPLLALTIAVLAPSTTLAQVSGKAFEGFNKNSKDPVNIAADELEVLDTQKKAVYRGRVKVRQGTSVLTADSLTAHYAKGANTGLGALEKLVFVGNVVVVSGQNTATAQRGSYNVRTQQVLMSGNVVISQGENAAKGNQLSVNLRTNVAKLKGGKKSGRVSTIFTPNK